MEQWNAMLDRIAGSISKTSFETWFGSTTAEILDGNTFIIYAPNSFGRDWLVNHYTHLITDTVRDITGLAYKIEIQTSNNRDDEKIVPSTNSYTSNTDSKYEELRALIHQQSTLILKQQVRIDELEQRIALQESKN